MFNSFQNTRITVIGTGGTGSALLPLLVGHAPEHIRMVDGDVLEAKNLERQVLYGPSDVGRPKAQAAAERLAHQCRNTLLQPVPEFLHAGNAHTLLAGSAVVADCTDDLYARLLLDRICKELGLPLVSAAVHGQQIQVLSLHQASASMPLGLSHRDWFPLPLHSSQSECDMRSVPGAITTLAAACMALRIKAVVAGDPSFAEVMDVIDPVHGSWMRIAAPKGPDHYELIASSLTGSRGSAVPHQLPINGDGHTA